ncbi:hypothetical protein DM860_006813 [Cuscuta australis]|uniref:Uncharacterized protein n=1 Tax=Cuscuta australis TaxID=267555 RepID=A0A328E9H4_9ASTE|nr:hypothetical protein DM860_006813 [Cuscuta australis]
MKRLPSIVSSLPSDSSSRGDFICSSLDLTHPLSYMDVLIVDDKEVVVRQSGMADPFFLWSESRRDNPQIATRERAADSSRSREITHPPTSSFKVRRRPDADRSGYGRVQFSGRVYANGFLTHRISVLQRFTAFLSRVTNPGLLTEIIEPNV